jgi:hypothetical protein
MTVEITKEDEALVRQMIERGQFENPDALVHAAIERLGATNSELPVYPPGSLLDLYTPEENDREARLAGAYPKKLEGF